MRSPPAAQLFWWQNLAALISNFSLSLVTASSVLDGKACCDGGSLYKVYAMLVSYISCWRCVDMLLSATASPSTTLTAKDLS
ncbi:TPA: hypothetical protein ACH3X3_003599 [Trebouxia sp. C0006]